MERSEDFLFDTMEDVFSVFAPDDIAKSSRDVVDSYLKRGPHKVGQITWAEFEPNGAFSRGGISNAELMTCRIVSDRSAEPAIADIIDRLEYEKVRPGHLIRLENGEGHIWCVPYRTGNPAINPSIRTRAILLTEALFVEIVDLFNSDVGLTRSEKRIVYQIVIGHNPSTAALEDGLSVETKRSQLKDATAKLECRSQPELVRYFISQLIHLLYLCESESTDMSILEAFDSRFLNGIGRLSVQRVSSGRVMRYWEFGPSDGRPIMAMHGYLFPFLVLQAEDFLKKHGLRLILPLRRGYLDNLSLSGLSEIDHLIDENVEDIVLFAQVHCRNPMPVLGHNMGAAYAILAAANHPELFSEVLLTSINLIARKKSRTSAPSRFVGGLRRLADHGGIYEIAARKLQKMVLHNEQASKLVLRRLFKDSRFDFDVINGGASGAPAFEWFREIALNSAIGFAADVTLLSRPIDEAMKKIALPTTFVHGTDDPYTSIAEVGQYAAAMPEAAVKLIDDSGHYASASRPDVFWETVARKID